VLFQPLLLSLLSAGSATLLLHAAAAGCAPEGAAQACEDADLALHIVQVLRLLLGCRVGRGGRGRQRAGQGREDECALSRCCACFCAAYRAGVAARLRYCHELADSLFIRVMQATKAMQAKKAGAALDRLGMSSVLDTDLQANSMPLLLSTTVLQASKWMIQQSEQRVGLNLQLFTCRLGAAAAAS
jgi:hypothetical protein